MSATDTIDVAALGWQIADEQWLDTFAKKALAKRIDEAIATALQSQADALAEARRERAFTLTDHQRLLCRDDVTGICDSINICFDTATKARCGPCAIKQAAAAGVETDYSLPASPQEARLKRELATMREALEKALAKVEYQPGDHPVVPIKHAQFVEEIRALGGSNAE